MNQEIKKTIIDTFSFFGEKNYATLKPFEFQEKINYNWHFFQVIQLRVDWIYGLFFYSGGSLKVRF